MNLADLQALYSEAVKIIRKERSARTYVFRNDPPKLALKIAEIDRLETILTTFKDALKPTAIPPNQPEQQTLIDVPKKADYP